MMKNSPFKLRRVRLQLMLKHPYLASAVARYPLLIRSHEEGISTMATDGYRIYANLEFIEKISSEELLGVLAHELMHNLLGHLEREQGRDPGRWNLAIDHATNILLEEMGFELPDPKCYDPRFYGMTAEEIYESMPRHNVSKNWDLHLDQVDVGHFPKMGKKEDNDQNNKSGILSNSEDQEELTDHPTNLELKRIREGLQKEMYREIKQRSLDGELSGNLPGLLKQEIDQAGAAQIPWQDLLSRFMGGLKRSDFRSYPFNRKHLWRGICLPSIGIPGPEHLVAAVDTSGSMSEKLLSQVLCELDRIKTVAE